MNIANTAASIVTNPSAHPVVRNVINPSRFSDIIQFSSEPELRGVAQQLHGALKEFGGIRNEVHDMLVQRIRSVRQTIALLS